MGQIVEIPVEVERFATTCVDVGVDVHRVLGPGFKEIIYERAYCLELDARGVPFETEKPIVVNSRSRLCASSSSASSLGVFGH